MTWVVILILIVDKSVRKEKWLKLAEMWKLLGSNMFAFHTDFRSYQALVFF